jgi:hypothetical protein
MGKRVIATAVAVVLTCGLMSSCTSQAAGVPTAPPAARVSDTATAAEGRAVTALRTWLEDPTAGSLTISSVEMGAAPRSAVSRQLTGRLDPFIDAASLSGTLNVLSGSSTVQDPLTVIQAGGRLYSSIPSAQQRAYPGRKWFEDDLSSVEATGSSHSVWWIALFALENVHIDGPSEVDGKSATEYTGTVDLAQIPDAVAQVSKSPVFEKAGTTVVSIDLYTDLGTGELARLTYRLGLQVSVDATPTALSTAGYEVDLGGFDVPVKPTQSPMVAPDPTQVEPHASSGDLSQLVFF